MNIWLLSDLKVSKLDRYFLSSFRIYEAMAWEDDSIRFYESGQTRRIPIEPTEAHRTGWSILNCLEDGETLRLARLSFPFLSLPRKVSATSSPIVRREDVAIVFIRHSKDDLNIVVVKAIEADLPF